MDDFFFFEYYQMKLRQFFFMGRKVYITNIATTVKFRIASLFSLAYLSVQQTRFSLKQHIYAFKNGGGRNTRRSHLQLQLWELNYIHIRISLREFSVCRRQSDFVKTLKSFYGPNLLQLFRFFNPTSVHAISQFAGQATYAVFLFAFLYKND